MIFRVDLDDQGRKLMDHNFQVLDWDSSFFGFRVARIQPKTLDIQLLSGILDQLREERVSLAYWATDPEDAPSQEDVKNLNGFLADKKVTYVVDLPRQLGALPFHKQQIMEYALDAPNESLNNLALQSGEYSRFRTDPKIPVHKFEALYRLWINNSVNKKIAETVFVWQEYDQTAGMITVGTKNGRGDIGLLAVDSSFRGRKIGENLMTVAESWFIQKGHQKAQVVTQMVNKNACRFYEKCGYSLESVDYVYHFWL